MTNINLIRLISPLKALLAMLALTLCIAGVADPRPAAAQGQEPRIWMPLVVKSYVSPENRLCRLGVAGSSDIGSYSVTPLRIGSYMDWDARTQPQRPGAITYVPTIRLAQTGSSSYRVLSPDPATITATVKALPGAMWLVGNEPDQRRQDNLEPQVYARAYHDLYCQIKGNCPPNFAPGLDPTAQIVAGSIVQPTPLRLRYLDLVVGSYENLYGMAMPVDAWAIHTYPLNEQSCDLRCAGHNNCWGADIPPGMDDCEGTHFYIADSIDTRLFQEYVVNFRSWMALHGYQERPLLLTEWGVLMPNMYVTDAQVNNYMNVTMQYLLTATDPTTGYPADNNRLVQRALWFSLNATRNGEGAEWNGWLFDPDTKTRTVFGNNFAVRTKPIVPYVNLKPLDRPSAAKSPSGGYTISSQIVNNGNMSTSRPFVVRFIDAASGQPIGDQTIGQLEGCAIPSTSVSVTWQGGASGKQFYVLVDPTNQIDEDKADNQVTGTVP